MLPPIPPSVKDGRRIRGNLRNSRDFMPSSRELTYELFGVSSPIFVIASLNSSLSSAFLIAGSFAPMSSTLNLSRTPFSEIAIARFSAVCPPIVGRRASGLSFSIIISRISGVRGSM